MLATQSEYQILSKDFYNQDTLQLAKNLLGKFLIHKVGSEIVGGKITEVEAYLPLTDKASHAYIGKTKRNESMFLGPGSLYLYKIHTHTCLNIVSEQNDIGAAILIRSLEPIWGTEFMQNMRQITDLSALTTGPGKLCQALQISMDLNGSSVFNPESPLQILKDKSDLTPPIVETKRVGITKDADLPYRFYIDGNKFVSRK